MINKEQRNNETTDDGSAAATASVAETEAQEQPKNRKQTKRECVQI